MNDTVDKKQETWLDKVISILDKLWVLLPVWLAILAIELGLEQHPALLLGSVFLFSIAIPFTFRLLGLIFKTPYGLSKRGKNSFFGSSEDSLIKLLLNGAILGMVLSIGVYIWVMRPMTETFLDKYGWIFITAFALAIAYVVIRYRRSIIHVLKHIFGPD